MIDLHVHLLPGVDDGPADRAEAIAMCRAAAADGVEVAVATPHQRNAFWPDVHGPVIEERHADLAVEVGEVLDLRLGAEIRVDSELVGEVERMPESGLLPLAGSRYLLLEPHPMPVGPDLRDLVNELVVAGWRPVIAHPERVPWVAETPGLLAGMVRLGAAVQVTAMSVTGDLGRPNRACCARLLDAGLVHFVGSDGHDLRGRPPRLSAAYDTVRARWGADTADRLFITNPRAVLDDRPLP
jgi:protein-tyrosine phosphatase